MQSYIVERDFFLKKKLKNQKFLDESDVKSDEEEKDEEEIDFREAFEKEMEQLKSTDKKIVKIRNIKMDVECVVFLKVHSSINPVELVKKVLENAQETKISRTRSFFSNRRNNKIQL